MNYKKFNRPRTSSEKITEKLEELKTSFPKDVIEFLIESNAIEREYSKIGLFDAISAWDYAYRNRKDITFNRILDIHKNLMGRLRGDIAGQLRTCTVTIGGEIKEYRGEEVLKSMLQDFVDYMIVSKENDLKEKDKEKFTKDAHIMFENIHPFEDCNGRTGRILMNIHRLNLNLPIKIIHGWKEGEDELHPEQAEYYKWFKNNE